LDQARPSLLRRLFASFTRRHYDFSHEVYNAMDGCLSCQACATQCPVQVDVPGFRSRFLALYHDRYMRPLRDHFIARLETVAAGFARIPRLANALTQNPITRGFLRHVVGIVDPPRWSVPTAAAGLAQRQIPAYRPELVTERTVALLPDAFTTYYDAPVLLAAVDVIQRCGYQVLLLPYRPSGKALHVKGFHRRFEKQARENAAWLQTVAEAEVPIVGVDPAVVLFFRREIAAMSDEPAPPQVKLLQEWLVEQDLPTVRTVPESPYRLFAHCTERATEPATDARWTQIFASLGLALEPIRVGCCGMCGAFGHERHHREESQGIYQLSWGRYLPAENADRKRVLATGYSCRAQVARFDGFRPLHPVEVLALHLDNPAL
jgi:Fe-S oxidoreductase